ncbi:nuclease domain-containing protein [Dickeya sp. ws52]|uniref:nuclease domain-containing protein n=1 Tax=Dickeya sp. ws52 TaxID=2576377 RepID=UPI0011814C7B|nr:nuclease domain-containing protein [Dickeya sp. ws52]TYL44600.1 DUF1364 domain-containing protein [Dickeya sp. ws52]
MIRKSPAFRSKALREPAYGQVCTLQIPGICNGNPETTVLCHLPSPTHGMGYKGDDFWAVYSYSSCHDVIDRRVPYDWVQEEVFLQALYLIFKFILERGS